MTLKLFQQKIRLEQLKVRILKLQYLLSMSSREDCIYLAKLNESAERYEGLFLLF